MPVLKKRANRDNEHGVGYLKRRNERAEARVVKEVYPFQGEGMVKDVIFI